MKLVELVVSCGVDDLERTGTNAVYTSHIVIMEALGTWVEESILMRHYGRRVHRCCIQSVVGGRLT